MSYEREQERLLALYNELEDEDEDIVGSDDGEIDEVEANEYDSSSEQSEEEEIVQSENDDIAVDERLLYVGKNKETLWNKFPVVSNKTRKKIGQTVTQAPGVIGPARLATTAIEAWKCFFPDEVIQEIVEYTNEYIRNKRQNFQRERDAADTDECEIKAVIGLLYIAGVLKSSHLNLRDLYNQDGTGVEMFRLTMGINRLQFLLRTLRFDNIEDREMRKKTDKFAPVRNLFDGFVQRCLANYSPNDCVTLDEMLESFRGRCPFRQYMPKKPARYGLKIWALVDSESFYTYNMEPYVGVQPPGPYKVDNSAHQVVKRLTRPISGTGRNVTCDNWFSSIPLAIDLYTNDKLTLVGTLRKNKKEIPPLFIAKIKDRKLYSTIFGFTKEMTLLSYMPKKHKYVLCLSTMHHEDEIDSTTGELCKPRIVTYYNSTKGGVDVVDEMKGSYSVSRASRRWPLTIFYTLLNIAGINSQIVFQSNTNRKLHRKHFLKELGLVLINDYLVKRQQIVTLPKSIKIRIDEILGEPEAKELPKTSVSGRCYLCSYKKIRKTSTQCRSCQKSICREHTVPSCLTCAKGGGVETLDD